MKQFQTDLGGIQVDGIPGQMTQAALQKAVGESWQRSTEKNATAGENATGTFWDEIEYFTPPEFACPCGCGTGDPEESLVRKVDEIRRRLGGLIEIDDYEVGTLNCFTPLAMEQAYAEVLLTLQNWVQEALEKEEYA